jgi:alkylated DNA repair protein (DNA oxidative demethylase)
MQSLPDGVRHLSLYLDRAAQAALVDEIRTVVAQAPLFTPAMPKTGKEMSVRMTNCGTLGWVTDRERGYRYQATHPVTGKPWPPIPDSLVALWHEVGSYSAPPEACLVNFYAATAKMGLHQDRDEEDFDAPIVSVSLGDDCLFRVGGTTRKDPTVSIRLRSGDVIVLSGPSRLAYHGVDRIYPDTSTLLPKGGRINLTLRRVTKP